MRSFVHILHVIHSIDPRSGGPSNALRGLVREQVLRGHRVTVVGTTAQSAEPWAPEGEFVARMRADLAFRDVELLLGRAWGRYRPWSRFSYCPQVVHLLNGRLADPGTRPDIIHIHGQFSHLTIRAAQLARRWHVPYVIRPAGSFDETCLAKGMTHWKRLFLRLFHRRDLKRAAAVQATSQAEAAQIARLVPGCRLAVVPHGVHLTVEPGDPERLVARYPQLRGKPVVLFMSRLHEKKRPQWVVEACRRLHTQFPELALVFAGPDAGMGDGLRRQCQQAGLEGATVFSGFLQGSEKAEAFELAHVLCLPSQDENFGVVVVEAMAHGVPVVVTPGVATHVYVDESGCGFTVEDSVEGVAEGIRRVLLSDRQELGCRGRAYVEKHLTWQVVAEKVDQLYEAALYGPAEISVESSND